MASFNVSFISSTCWWTYIIQPENAKRSNRSAPESIINVSYGCFLYTHYSNLSQSTLLPFFSKQVRILHSLIRTHRYSTMTLAVLKIRTTSTAIYSIILHNTIIIYEDPDIASCQNGHQFISNVFYIIVPMFEQLNEKRDCISSVGKPSSETVR